MTLASAVALRFKFCSTAAATRDGLSCTGMSASRAAYEDMEHSRRGFQRIPEPSLGHPRVHGHRGWRRLWPQALGAGSVR